MKQLNNQGFLSLNRLEACLNRETESDKIEQFFHCFDCGNEGIREDFDKESDCESCEQIAKGLFKQ